MVVGDGKSMEVAVTNEQPSARPGPALVLGPMLRYVSETEATIWVETDRECQVEVLGRGVPTFEVAGHHYGLVVVDGLAPGSEHEYQVALDGAGRGARARAPGRRRGHRRARGLRRDAFPRPA